ncbi:vitamin B6 photo-protection and homoeostasis-domain-containing protein [Syncephalis fuscata]|nr:vitamin B6 photo-protection and homoeostasis-domain-containing protein [Syncephalis fuscata]
MLWNIGGTARYRLPVVVSRTLRSKWLASEYSTGSSARSSTGSKPLFIQQRERTLLGWRWTRMTPGQCDSAREDIDTNTSSILSTNNKARLTKPSSTAKFIMTDSRETRLIDAARDGLRAAFLPRNYPKSVTSEYMPYSLWQFVHNLTGSINGGILVYQSVLSMQCLLFAVGLGAGSIPMAAALNWIIKDGLGQLGGVLYAGVVGDRFDSEPKRHRMRAAVLMQLAGAIEIVSPLWPGGFLAIASISNIGKNVAWLAAGATRTQMQQTLACHDNLGDVTAKSGSQSTAAGLIGTGIGVVVCTAANSNLIITAAIYAAFSVLNLHACYRLTAVVRTRTLNTTRFEMAIWPVIRNYKHTDAKLDMTQALTPTCVAEHESFIRRTPSQFTTRLEMDVPLRHLSYKLALYSPVPTNGARPLNYRRLTDLFTQRHLCQSEKYYIAVANHQVWIWYAVGAQDIDLIRGIYHASLLRRLLDTAELPKNNMASLKPSRINHHYDQLVHQTHNTVVNTFDQLLDQLSSYGWDTAHVFIGQRSHRIRVKI